MNCLLIYNPSSGTSRKLTRKLDYIKAKLSEKFDNIEIRPTQYAGHATLIAKEACGKYDYLILAGGDGTFNEVINGVAKEKVKPILGYIPCGTVCDMSNNLKMSKNIKKSVNLILNGKVESHDVCQINDHYFIYVAALGGYSAISYGLKSKAKQAMGKFAYFVNGIKLLFKVKNKPFKIKITLDDKVYEDMYSYVFVMNTVSIGGFKLNEKAKLNDGKVDLLLIKKSFLNGLLKILKIFTLGLVRIKDRHIQKIEASKFKIEFDEKINWNLDGEEGFQGNAEFKVLKHNVKMIVAPEMEEWF